MFGLSKILRVGEGRAVKRLKKIADEVIALEPEYADLSDEELKAKTAEFKKRLKKGETLDDILLEAFAVAREASWRVLDQKHYPVQIMGGAALHFGNVAMPSKAKACTWSPSMTTLPSATRSGWVACTASWD